MFNKKQNPLDAEIDRVIRELNNHEIGSTEYVKTMRLVSQLQALDPKERVTPLSRDTLVIVGANLLGILMIINHENANVISSKALSFVLTPRLK